MAWEDTMHDAKWRDVVFDCQLADDDGERHAAEHTRPFVDGAKMEDLGRGARRIRMKAIFFGDDYEEKLRKFVDALEIPGEGDLVHPVFGPLKAQVLPWHIHHEAELVDQAEVEVSFAESALATPIFAEAKPKQKAAAVAAKSSTARSAAADVLAKAAAACKKAMAMSRAGLRVIAELKAMVDSATTSGSGILSLPRVWATDVASLIGSIVDLKSGGASALADFKAAYSILTGAILSLTGTGSGSGDGNSDAALPLTSGEELEQVRAHVELERALGVAEAAQAVLEAEAETPTLTPAEVEAVAAQTRKLIQARIDDYRGLFGLEDSRPVVEALKDVAAAVQQAAAAILEARPPLVAHTVAARTCPRLLAHQIYGDHTRAGEIVRLNTLADPNFLTVGTVLRVYAE
jgi:prophage DNA circulation protein